MSCKRRTNLFALVTLLLFSVALTAVAQQRTPIILDTDIGGDIDDAFAVALVLDSPQLDLRAVTTVSGDTAARARLVAKMLSAAGRTEVPVAAGAAGAKINTTYTQWADGFSSPALVSQSAVELMKSVLDKGHRQVMIVAVGPLTNLAALLKQYPAEKKNIRQIVLMGGSIRRGYYPNSGPTAEYNIAEDAAASQVVFSSGVPILMAPLDVTARLQLEKPELDRLFALHTALTDALEAQYKLWGQPVPTLHDPMAVSLLIAPELCTRQPLVINITDKGMTVPVQGKSANAVVAIETDPGRFIDFYMSRVAH